MINYAITGDFLMPSLPAMSGMLQSPDMRHRLDVASRTLAGIGGGYALTAATTMFLGLTLPLSKGTAVMTATMLSFTIYTCAIIWAFSVRSRRVWPGIVLPALVLGGGALLVKALATNGGTP